MISINIGIESGKWCFCQSIFAIMLTGAVGDPAKAHTLDLLSTMPVIESLDHDVGLTFFRTELNFWNTKEIVAILQTGHNYSHSIHLLSACVTLGCSHQPFIDKGDSCWTFNQITHAFSLLLCTIRQHSRYCLHQLCCYRYMFYSVGYNFHLFWSLISSVLPQSN